MINYYNYIIYNSIDDFSAVENTHLQFFDIKNDETSA